VRTELTGVPETALITLRNRASEAARPDGVLSDPQAVALLERVGGTERYATFADADQAIALRARVFDDITRRFLTEHPGATVVALGEGLQTSFWRIGDPHVDWLTVDLPEVVALRRRLLPAEPQVRAFAGSALDKAWMDAVAPGTPTLITAEGLLMYLPPDEVRALLRDCADRFPGGAMVFDTIPDWASTTEGAWLSAGYRLPAMPFHLSRREALRLAGTVPGIVEVIDVPAPAGRGPAAAVVRLAWNLPVVRDVRPTVTVLRFG
jgi:O-methyltransferase involved in polyketide biosynthesis